MFNTDEFISRYVIHGECIVNGSGDEIEGVESSSSNPHCDKDWSVEIMEAYKCGNCGSENIYDEDADEYIWYCAYCGDEFPYSKGYNKEKGIVLCPRCNGDDVHFDRGADKG